jgi:hypothetical protein
MTLWGSRSTSKQSLLARNRLNKRILIDIRGLFHLRMRALGNAPFLVALKAPAAHELQPESATSVDPWARTPLEPLQDLSTDGEEALTIFGEPQGSSTNFHIFSDDSTFQFEEARTQEEEEEQEEQEEQYNQDTFPAHLQRVLDINDEAKALVKSLRQRLMEPCDDEKPGLPNVETIIKNEISIIIGDATRRQALTASWQDLAHVLDVDPDDWMFLPPALAKYSDIMHGRSSRHPVSESDIKRLDKFICRALNYKKQMNEEMELLLDTYKMKWKRWHRSDLGGGIVNFLKSGGKGSGLKQCINAGEQWPDEWSLGLEEPRHIMSEEYAEGVKAMEAADELIQEKEMVRLGRAKPKRRRYNPKW